MTDYPKRYWDACNWISLITEDERQRADVCERILEEAESGACRIITSTITLAEVVKVRGRPLLGEDQEKIILAFFEHEFIAVHDVTRHVAEQARLLSRHHALRPMDAIHLATALITEADVFETWNTRDFMPLQGQLPIEIREPTWIGTIPMDLA